MRHNIDDAPRGQFVLSGLLRTHKVLAPKHCIAHQVYIDFISAPDIQPIYQLMRNMAISTLI